LRAVSEAVEAVYGLLGLAMRAGKLAPGQEQALQVIRRGRAHLVILAADASANTKKVFYDKGAYYRVPVREKGSMERLGSALGLGPRAAVAVTDSSFARNMLEKMDQRKGSSTM
jgi:ribosomal protein L7Ae-like RNA K-turn-binding protein